jgi:hypothetical protein
MNLTLESVDVSTEVKYKLINIFVLAFAMVKALTFARIYPVV